MKTRNEMPPATGARCILIVEDDGDVLAFLQSVLQRAGYLVMPAVDGKAALAWLRRPTKPDLILLDCGLPDMDGIEICKAIKRNPETQRIPTVILTGNTDNGLKIRAHGAAADQFLNKPIRNEDLLLVIAQFFDPAGARLRRGLLHRCGLEADPDRRTVFYSGKSLKLSGRLFDLLYLLAAHYPDTLRCAYIVDHVAPGALDHEADVLVCRLRAELRASFGVNLIDTASGVGYRLQFPSLTTEDS